MSDLPPRVILEPAPGLPATSGVRWDEESGVLSIDVHYPASTTSHATMNLSQQLDRARGIEPQERRLMLGNLEVAFDDRERICLLEIRTNPIDWTAENFLSLPQHRESAAVRFVADYDLHGIATLDVSLRICRDHAQHALGFKFGDYVAWRWADVANGLAIGVTQDDYLSELRLLNVELDV